MEEGKDMYDLYISTYVCTIDTVCDNIMLTVHDLIICNGTLTLYCHIRMYCMLIMAVNHTAR